MTTPSTEIVEVAAGVTVVSMDTEGEGEVAFVPMVVVLLFPVLLVPETVDVEMGIDVVLDVRLLTEETVVGVVTVLLVVEVTLGEVVVVPVVATVVFVVAAAAVVLVTVVALVSTASHSKQKHRARKSNQPRHRRRRFMRWAGESW